MKINITPNIINIKSLEKAEKRIWVKPTSKRIGHYRKIKGAEKVNNEAEFLDLAIKGYTAQGGIMSSKYMYGSLEREAINNHLETTKPNAVNKVIHRGLAFSDAEWEKVWEQWTEPGSTVKFDNFKSFTLDKKRAPIHGVGDVKVVLSIKNKSGIDISKQSVYPEEGEVLTPVGFEWKVISAGGPGSTWYIEGEEVSDEIVSPETSKENATKFFDECKKTKEGQKDLRTVYSYSSTNYKQINHYLISGEAIYLTKDELKIMIDDLKKIIKKAPKYQGEVYRGMRFENKDDFDKFLSKCELDQELLMENFVSSSIDKNIASEFFTQSASSYAISFKIKSKNGVYLNGASANSMENEVLFNNDSIFKISSVKKITDNRFDIIMEEV